MLTPFVPGFCSNVRRKCGVLNSMLKVVDHFQPDVGSPTPNIVNDLRLARIVYISKGPMANDTTRLNSIPNAVRLSKH
jgi:hypothetical protein